MLIESYREEYYQGVVECLRRNFKWMGESTAAVVGEWLTPIISYKWSDDIEVSKNEYPYKHGAVLIDNDDIVGYFGMIASKRQIGDERMVCVAPTTWGIDEKYRFEFADILKQILLRDCFFLDLTPRRSVELTLKHFFGFKEISTVNNRFLPIPCHTDNIIIKWINKSEEISESLMRIEFEDHKKYYGVNLIEMISRTSGERGYVFYKVYDEPERRIRLLKIYNTDFFVNACHEIVWKVYVKEKLEGLSETEANGFILSNMYDKKRVCVECDGMLIGGREPLYPYLKKAKVARLCNSENDIKTGDFLYTEMALLSYGL